MAEILRLSDYIDGEAIHSCVADTPVVSSRIAEVSEGYRGRVVNILRYQVMEKWIDGLNDGVPKVSAHRFIFRKLQRFSKRHRAAQLNWYQGQRLAEKLRSLSLHCTYEVHAKVLQRIAEYVCVYFMMPTVGTMQRLCEAEGINLPS